MEQQYDMSKRELRLFEEKQKQRLANREYFLKMVHSPSPSTTLPSDQAFARHYAMLEYKHEYLRLNGKHIKGLFFVFALPIFTMYQAFRYHMFDEEQSIRRGEVAYKDRPWRHIC